MLSTSLIAVDGVGKVGLKILKEQAVNIAATCFLFQKRDPIDAHRNIKKNNF